MALLDNITHGEPVDAHRPWPRVDRRRRRLAAGDRACLRPAAAHCSACGATPPHVHMALLDETSATSPSSAIACNAGTYPSVAARHPPAIRLERAIRDLFGSKPIGTPDHAALARSWLLGRAASARRTERRAASPRRTNSCRRKARACTRSRSGRCMPASSSRDISASPPTARHVVRLEQRLG